MSGQPKLLQCKRCKLGIYCSRECQVDHWTNGPHKAVCKPFVDTVYADYQKGISSISAPFVEKSQFIGDDFNAEFTREQQAYREGQEREGLLDPLVDVDQMDEDERREYDIALAKAEDDIQRANEALRAYARLFRDPLGEGAAFSNRFFQAMFTVADSTYYNFRVLFDAVMRDRQIGLMRWARSNMEQPPQQPTPGALARIERTYLQRKTGSQESEEDQILEFQLKMFNKIDQVMTEMEGRHNDPNGIQLSREMQEDGTFRQGAPILCGEGEPRRLWLASLADRLENFASFIGLGDAKESMVGLLSSFLSRPVGFIDGHRNIMLWGNPGTGKTEVGKIIGPIFFNMGFLAMDPGEGFVEKTKADFIAPYSGQTTHKTKMLLANNLGGVVFLDEAYDLVQKDGKEDYGVEALNQIVAFLGTYKGMITLVLAGYERQIRENLMEKNPGLDSRFPDKWSFDNYTPEQLYKIFIFMARKKRVLIEEPDNAAPLNKAKDSLFNAIKAVHRLGGFEKDNARGADNILNDAIRWLSYRSMRNVMENPQDAQFGRIGEVLRIGTDAIEAAFVRYGRKKGILVTRGAQGAGRNLPQPPPGDDPRDDDDDDEDGGPEVYRPRGVIPSSQDRRRAAGLLVQPDAEPRGGRGRRRRAGGDQEDEDRIRRVSLQQEQLNFDTDIDRNLLADNGKIAEALEYYANNVGRFRNLPTARDTSVQIGEARGEVGELLQDLGPTIQNWRGQRDYWQQALDIVTDVQNERRMWEWDADQADYSPERLQAGIEAYNRIIQGATEEYQRLSDWMERSQMFLEAAQQSERQATQERRQGRAGRRSPQATPISRRRSPIRRGSPPASPDSSESGSYKESPQSSSEQDDDEPEASPANPSPSPPKKGPMLRTKRKKASRARGGGRSSKAPSRPKMQTSLPNNPTVEDVDQLTSEQLQQELRARGKTPSIRGRGMDNTNRAALKDLLGL